MRLQTGEKLKCCEARDTSDHDIQFTSQISKEKRNAAKDH
jgi:hypothetical protein